MKDVAYYNGHISPINDMMIPMNDRAVYFGDGVYDMAYVHRGVCFALQEHIDRFFSSCHLLELSPDMMPNQLETLLVSLISKLDKDIVDACIYFQLSRGTAARNHAFPPRIVKPNLLVYLKAFSPSDTPMEFRLISMEDTRFRHCNIKSLNLIPNVIATQRAAEQGCQECVLHRNGFVTECAHSGISILKKGELVTTPLSEWILPSITRKHLLEICRQLGIPVREENYTLEELYKADEVIVTSSLTLFSRVFEIDGIPVGGKSLGLFKKINQTYLRRFEDETSPV